MKTKTMDWELLFIILSSLIAAGLAINAQISSKKKDKNLEDKTEKIVLLQTKLNEQSEKLIDAQDKLMKYTIGGDSFGVVKLISILKEDEGRYYNFYYENQGEYPLYDLSITVLNRNSLNMEEIKKRNGVATDSDFKNYKTYEIGNIGSRRGKGIQDFYFKPQEGILQDYLFQINSRNKSFVQVMKFIVSNGTYKKATRLQLIDRTQKEKLKVIFEVVDDGFPGKEDKNFKW